MVTAQNNPQIDGTIRVVIEYDQSQSSQFEQQSNRPVFSSSNPSPPSSSAEKFNSAPLMNEMVAVLKDIQSITGSVAIQMGMMLNNMKSHNTAMAAMTVEARKETEMKANINRRNRESRKEQDRRNELNEAKVATQGARTEQIDKSSMLQVEKINAQLTKVSQDIITSQEKIANEKKLNDAKLATQQARTTQIDTATSLQEQKMEAQLAKVAQGIVASQEKIARENRVASARTRRDNKSSREGERRNEEKHEVQLLKLLETAKKEAANAQIQQARVITAQEYAKDAGLRRQAREIRNQMRVDFADVDQMAGETRREREQEKQRRRNIISQYGEEEGGKMLHMEQLQKRKQQKDWTDQFNRQNRTVFDTKPMTDIKGILTNLVGIFTIGTAFRNSKVANNLLGTISTILGTMMDVFLAPFLPLLVPAIQALAKMIPVLQQVMEKIADFLGLNKQKEVVEGAFGQADVSTFIAEPLSKWDITKAIFGLGGIGIGLLTAGAVLNALFQGVTMGTGRILLKIFGRGTIGGARILTKLFGRGAISGARVLTKLFGGVTIRGAGILTRIFGNVTLTSANVLGKLFSGVTIRGAGILTRIFSGVTIGNAAVLGRLLGSVAISSANVLSALFSNIAITSANILGRLFGSVALTSGSILNKLFGAGRGAFLSVTDMMSRLFGIKTPTPTNIPKPSVPVGGTSTAIGGGTVGGVAGTTSVGLSTAALLSTIAAIGLYGTPGSDVTTSQGAASTILNTNPTGGMLGTGGRNSFPQWLRNATQLQGMGGIQEWLSTQEAFNYANRGFAMSNPDASGFRYSEKWLDTPQLTMNWQDLGEGQYGVSRMRGPGGVSTEDWPRVAQYIADAIRGAISDPNINVTIAPVSTNDDARFMNQMGEPKFDFVVSTADARGSE